MTNRAVDCSRRWSAHPAPASLVRAAAILVPIGASVAFVYAASRVVPPPTGELAHYLGWWLGLSLTATLVLVAVGRVSRRLLPLATLLRLSLAFPDATPSRFRTALASGTVGSLEQRLAAARRCDATPAESARRLLTLVAALDSHDGLTRGHSERVRAYSQLIGRELGLGRHELDLLNWAALLHDIGKLEISREILNKTGRPTDEEWAVIRSHPRLGETLVAPLRGWLGEWAAAVGDHHEHWDGGGYPRGLSGQEISLAGRIVAVADVFDVITSTRSYKEPSTMTAARAEIARCAGSQFDPEVARAFLAVSLGRVRLATGPASWLGHAAVLARTPLTSAAWALSAAAVVGLSVAPGGIVERSVLSGETDPGRPIAASPLAPQTGAPVKPGDRTPPDPGASRGHPSPGAAPTAAEAEPARGAAAPVTPSAPAVSPSSGPPSEPTRSQPADPAPTTPAPGSSEQLPPPGPPGLPLPESPELPAAPSLPPAPTVPSVPFVPGLPTSPDVPTAPALPTVPSAPSLPPAPSLPDGPALP